jgi:hypothetical protein
MIAVFQLVGNVGQVTVKPNRSGGQQTYLSLVTSDFYNGKMTQQWINNIVFFGNMGKIIQDKVVPGNQLFISGKIKIFKKGIKTTVYFAGDTFRVLRKTEEQVKESLQQREIETLESEEMYNSPHGIDESDVDDGTDLAY